MKYYCIGIKGSGMSCLAQILYDLGNEVIGYDDVKEHKYTEEGLEKRNIKIYYDNTHELDKDIIVTYSDAFSMDHPEIKRIKELGLKVELYAEILGKLSTMFKTIGISGTHGKTTTSTMIKHVLGSKYGCNYFIGDGSGYANKDNKFFILESDEYKKHFDTYMPYYAIVTNIELDHAECYNGLDDIIYNFNKFANKGEYAIVCGDSSNIRKMDIKTNTIYFGFNDNNDVIAKNVVLTDTGSSFDVYMNDYLYGHFDIPLYGNHMILNALACIIVCSKEGMSYKEIHDRLVTFKNAKRRFVIKELGNIIMVDDYAHHPTEIKVTLESAKQKYPNKEIVAVFLPNTYSRTRDLLNDFIDVFKYADKAYIMDIECNREKKEDYPGITSDSIIEKVNNAEKISIDTVDKLLKHDNSVICFMSCANIHPIEEAFEEALKKQV
jgi:UDP-N-acetylmuramate--alanine ligase